MLKNIQVLMDASVALMNQYTVISAQFPPLPTNPTPSTATNGTEASTAEEAPLTMKIAIDAKELPSTSMESPSTSKETSLTSKNLKNEEKIIFASNDVGPSTSKSNSIETLEIDGDVVTIEDIGQNDPSDPNDPVDELRRRRLQKFQANAQDS